MRLCELDYLGNKRMKKKILGIALIWAVMLLNGCESSSGEAVQDFYTVEYAYEEAVELPRQVICDAADAWILSSVKDAPVYYFQGSMGNISEIDFGLNADDYILALAKQGETLYLCTLSEDALCIRKENSSKILAKLPYKEEISEIQGFWVDKQERFYFVMENEIWVTNGEAYEEHFRVKGKAALFLQDDQVKCMVGSSDTLTLYHVDDHAFTEEWSVEYPCDHQLLFLHNDDAKLTIMSDDKILSLNVKDGTVLSECNLLECGIAFSDIYAGAFTDMENEEKRLCLFGKNAENHFVIYQLLKLDADKAKPREEITYGALVVNNALMNQIAEFNKHNSDYYITVKLYDNSEAGIMQMQMALSSGNGPDIVNLYAVDDYAVYAEKGYLENLTPYFQTLREEEADLYEDIMWQVLEPYRTDEEIYIVLPHFSISGLVMSPEDAPESGWNIEEMFRLIEKNAGQKNIFTNASAERILYTAFAGMKEQFLCYEDKTCNFTGDEFRRLLEYCKEYGTERSWSGTITMEEMMHQTLFMDMTFQSWTAYVEMIANYGHGTKIYGYPSQAGEKYVIKKTADACGIYAKSSCKEGAWEFIKMLFEDSYQEAELGFPICRKSFDRIWNNAKDYSIKTGSGIKLTIEDEDIAVFREIVDNGIFQNGEMEKVIINIILEEASAYFADEKDAETVAEIIQNRVQLVLEE